MTSHQSTLLLACVAGVGGMLLFGCATHPPNAKPAHIEVAAAPELEDDDAPPAPPLASDGCIVAETKLDGYIELRFEKGGASLAILRDASARLALAREPRWVEVERGGVMLRTPYDSSERPLHLRKAITLAGVLTPKPDAEISVLQSGAVGQLLRYTASEDLRGVVIEEHVACSDITLNTPEYEVPGDTDSEGTPVQLTGAVGVSASPGGPATLQLPAERGILADELERRSGQVKIRVDTTTELLIGWVPEAVVGEVQIGRGGGGYGTGIAAGQVRSQSHTVYQSCRREVTLYAELEGRVGEVGVVRRGGLFELVTDMERDVKAGFRVVDFWQDWIIQDPAMRFVVDSADLQDCRVAQ